MKPSIGGSRIRCRQGRQNHPRSWWAADQSSSKGCLRGAGRRECVRLGPAANRSIRIGLREYDSCESRNRIERRFLNGRVCRKAVRHSAAIMNFFYLRPDRIKMGPNALGAKSDGVGNCPSARVTGVTCSHTEDYNGYCRGFQLANIAMVITCKRIIWPEAGFMVIMVFKICLI